MTDTDKINLALTANQNKIAISLASFFTAEELEDIDVSAIQCPFDQIAEHPCGCMEYSKKFDGDKEFQIHCIIDTSIIPNVHFVSIRVKNSNLYQSDFKCNPNVHNMDYITMVIKRAINYRKFKSPEDIFYHKQNIIYNFSDKMLKDIGNNLKVYKDIKERFILVEKRCDELNGQVEGPVYIDYKSDNVLVIAETINDYLFKFSYINTETNKGDYCYFVKGHVGLDLVLLVINRCINIIAISNIDINLL